LRRIGVITTGRADYGIYLPLLKRIQADPECDLLLFVSGTHLDEGFGHTADRIKQDGFSATPVSTPTINTSPRDTALGIGAAVTAFAGAFAEHRPDILVVLGDRHEMLGAVTASVPYNIPIAHIHGGEITEGAIDEVFRHAITKMSHLHFPATETYARRIVRMGEEPWRVTACGAPSLDNLNDIDLLDRESLVQEIGFPLVPAPLLITYHPVTTQLDSIHDQLDVLLTAVDTFGHPAVFTAPNADARSSEIRCRIEQFVEGRSDRAFFVDLGTRRYFSLMKHAATMIGNSSSGIIEAASFGLPVVDIGTRQKGRDHGNNVIHTTVDASRILSAIELAFSPGFRRKVDGMTNPYGNGSTCDRILSVLKSVTLNRKLIAKRFFDGEKDAHSR
jgi:UDP-hydrolysing UDP-N-acetyl-D-glucosamine 2-epimerase